MQGHCVVTISRPTLNLRAEGQKRNQSSLPWGAQEAEGQEAGGNQAVAGRQKEEMGVAPCPPDGHTHGQSFSTLAHNRAGLSKNKGG